MMQFSNNIRGKSFGALVTGMVAGLIVCAGAVQAQDTAITVHVHTVVTRTPAWIDENGTHYHLSALQIADTKSHPVAFPIAAPAHPPVSQPERVDAPKIAL